MQDIVAPNNGTDDATPAIQAALDLGGAWRLPAGVYRTTAPIHARRHFVLHGDGGDSDFPATLIKPDPGVTGLILHGIQTSGTGTRADNAVIRDLQIRAASSGGVECHGIVAYCRFAAYEVHVRGFGGDGWRVLGGAAAGPNGEQTNANGFRIVGGSSWQNAANGIFLHGSDANAGVVSAVDLLGNGGYGVFDQSFLGNYFFGCHTAANQQGAYHLGGAANFGALLACYSESGQPPSVLNGRAVALGGDHGAGFSDDSVGVRLLGDHRGGFFEPGVRSYDRATGTVWGSLADPGDKTNKVALTFGSQEYVWRMLYEPGSVLKTWFLSGSGGANPVLAIPNPGNSMGAEVGVPVFLRGLYMANGPGQIRRWRSGTTAPTSGQHARGDVCWNANPSGGGSIGWVCVTAGTPGTWKAFGAIEP